MVVDGMGILILNHRVYLTPIRRGFQGCQPIHFILTERYSNPTLGTWSPRHRLKIMFLINLPS